MAMSRDRPPAPDTGGTPRSHDLIVSRGLRLRQKKQIRLVAKARSRAIERGATWQYLAMANRVRPLRGKSDAGSHPDSGGNPGTAIERP